MKEKVKFSKNHELEESITFNVTYAAQKKLKTWQDGSIVSQTHVLWHK